MGGKQTYNSEVRKHSSQAPQNVTALLPGIRVRKTEDCMTKETDYGENKISRNLKRMSGKI